MSLVGGAACSVTTAAERASSDARRWVDATATRSFQSVSPSSWSVRTKTTPLSLEVRSSTRSAGMRWLVPTRTTSPTRKSLAGTAIEPPPGCSRSYASLLISLSVRQRCTSS